MSFFTKILNKEEEEDIKNPFSKVYNGQTWIIQASLINIKRNINVVLTTLHINEMVLHNDILCMSPTFTLTYMDINLNLVHVLDNNDLLLKISMNQPSPNPEDQYWNKLNLLNINLLFNVDKILTVYKKKDMVIYKFFTTHYNRTLLLKNVNYATVKDLQNTLNTKESPLVLINQILSKAGYAVDEIVNDSLNKVDFITSQTMNVKDCVDHLLRKCITIHDPPTYFVHNLKSNKAMLINNKNIDQRLYNPINQFNVFGTPDSKDLHFDLATEATNIKTNSFNAGLLALRYLSEFIFRHFDQNTRSWSKTVFNYDIINNMFNRWILKLSELYESIFTTPLKVQKNEMKYDFPNYNELKMYLFLRELQLGTNSITFDVMGNITRDAGQYVTLQCANEAQIPRYEGMWNVYSCEHRWEGKTYTNQLVCYRTVNRKPIWTKPETQSQNT